MLEMIAGIIVGVIFTWYFGILPRKRFPEQYYKIENNQIVNK